MTIFPLLIARLIPNLGRDNDYEVITTVRAIGAALRGAGQDRYDVAAACASLPPPKHHLTNSTLRPALGDLARACRDLDHGHLTPRERGFVSDMVARGFAFRPTPKQAQWLGDIFDSLQSRAAV